MSTVDTSTNPQIEQDAAINPNQTEEQKIDQIAGEMASKAGRVEHREETSSHVGGVSPTSGGIFTK